jgi:hypothetical protein
MDNIEQNSETPPVQPEEELSHTDKLTGIFTEPTSTFERIAKFPPKTIDWLLPLIVLLFIISITRVLVMSNEEVAYQVKQMQEKSMNEMVEKGVLTREQADQQIEQSAKFSQGPVAWVIQTVSIFIFGSIVFFFVALIYFFFANFALKGEGSYSSALVASGLSAYIAIIQIVLASILAMAFGRLISDVSVASLASIDKTTITGFVLGKVDPFSIWAYSITSIGLAKMFRSDSTAKYFILVFGIWILGTFLLWGIGKLVPFLSFLSSM